MKNLMLFVIFTIFVGLQAFSQNSSQMKISNQSVADALDTVCLIHLDPISKKPVYGGQTRTVERRRLNVGETVVVDQNGKPISLLDGPAIYSAKFGSEYFWSSNKINSWQERSKKPNRFFNFLVNLGKNTCSLSGYVLSLDTLAPIGSDVSLTDQNGKLIAKANSDPVTGYYELKMPIFGQFTIEVKAKNFMLTSSSIESQKKGIQKDLFMPRVLNGNRIVLRNIFFEFNKAILQPQSFEELNHLASFLKEWPRMEIEISGYTDNKGTEKYNQALSEKRAQAVVNYLAGNGIDKARLSFKGFGMLDPIAPNTLPDGSDNPEGRQENRRTEFKILKI